LVKIGKDNDASPFGYKRRSNQDFLQLIFGHETREVYCTCQTSKFEAVSSVSPMKVTRDVDNAIEIEFCDLLIGDELTEDLNTYYAADKVYKHYGFKNGNPWNTSVQFKTNIVNRDTFGINTGFTATYHSM
jgi:hypothetical protein